MKTKTNLTQPFLVITIYAVEEICCSTEPVLVQINARSILAQNAKIWDLKSSSSLSKLRRDTFYRHKNTLNINTLFFSSLRERINCSYSRKLIWDNADGLFFKVRHTAFYAYITHCMYVNACSINTLFAVLVTPNRNKVSAKTRESAKFAWTK